MTAKEAAAGLEKVTDFVEETGLDGAKAMQVSGRAFAERQACVCVCVCVARARGGRPRSLRLRRADRRSP